ncbi:MAG TPA: DoxX family membrane protein, partial [Candidatus Peribacteria bacterium]|nr:DoxX family membrane protein [Candidatus Peribacteria bacterium]
PAAIAVDMAMQPVSPLSVIEHNLGLFFLWMFISLLTVFIVFFVSISRFAERKLDPVLVKMKHYAPAVSRMTVGLSFLAGAYYQASYGPELPMAPAFGAYTPVAVGVLAFIGVLIIAGLWTRFAAAVAFCFYFYAVYRNGAYMLTYTNYLGELIVLLLIGGHKLTVSGAPHPRMEALSEKLKPYSFFILRVFFGIALIYTSMYAKFQHSTLAFDVVEKYHMTSFFPFEAHFFVLGAGIIEIVIGMFFVLGIEIRFTALFFLFWLTSSLIFFGESVWPHIVLMGIPVALLMHGYDKFSLEGRFFKVGDREPVL